MALRCYGPDPPKAGAGGGFYDITVEPGNKLVRRKSDQLVTASYRDSRRRRCACSRSYKSSTKWEEAPMAPRATARRMNSFSPRCPSRSNITSKPRA